MVAMQLLPLCAIQAITLIVAVCVKAHASPRAGGDTSKLRERPANSNYRCYVEIYS